MGFWVLEEELQWKFIAVETRAIELNLPADSANLVSQAGLIEPSPTLQRRCESSN